MLVEIEFLIATSTGETQAAFLANPERQRAFVRSLEIIGEATKKMDRAFRDIHPEIDWRRIAGMRDKLIHDYVSVDNALVWDVAVNEIPGLLLKIKAILGID